MDWPCLKGIALQRFRRCTRLPHHPSRYLDKVRGRLLGNHLRLAIDHAMRAKGRAYASSVAAVLVLAVLLSWAGIWVWFHLAHLQTDFSIAQSESFHLAEHMHVRMRALTETLRLLDVRLDPASIADFHKQVGEMKLWITTNQVFVTTAEQRRILDRIEAALDDYSRKASSVLEENLRVGPSTKPEATSQRIEQDVSRLLGLAQELRVTEQYAYGRFVLSSHHAVRSLCVRVLIAIGLAFLLGLAVVRLIHVATVQPLQAELVQSHSALEQKEKLASLGTLAAGVAHEVRNPLTAISVRLHSLKREVGEHPSAADDLNVIHQEIKRMERIVEDFLQFARPSAPKVESFAVGSLFEQVIRLLSPQMKDEGLHWKTEAAPEVMALADVQQIEQVLINLIRNSIENMQPGGTITLRAKVGPIAWPFGVAPGTILEVADTGKGISPAVAKRIFDPFFTTKQNGTGLGLSMAALIIEQHGGQLRYQTKVGSGTTFSIMLPIAGGDKHGIP